MTLVADVERLVSATLGRFGHIDILINIAGTGEIGGFLDLTEDQWRKVFSVNVRCVFNVTRAALPHLIQSKAR